MQFYDKIMALFYTGDMMVHRRANIPALRHNILISNLKTLTNLIGVTQSSHFI